MDSDAIHQFIERARGLHARAELDSAAVSVFGALAVAGVDALLLKGPALVRTLYRSGEHRGYSDIDVLVDPEARDRARRVLAELGFADASARTTHGVVDVADVQHAEIWSRRGARAGPVLIDLHWRLPGWDAPPQVSWNALWRTRASIDLAGRRIAVPDQAGLALHLATHAAQHGREDLKALGDLSRGLDRWDRVVWARAAKLAGDVGAASSLAAGLRLVPAGVQMATELQLPVARELSWAIANRAKRPRGTFHLRALGEAKSARELLVVLRWSLLPTTLWITRRYPWALRSRLLLVPAYLAHIAATPVWAARAWRFSRRAD